MLNGIGFGRCFGECSQVRTKALLRLLVGEIRVVPPDDIWQTYRVPAAVRIPEELVGEGGFEPPRCRV